MGSLSEYRQIVEGSLVAAPVGHVDRAAQAGGARASRWPSLHCHSGDSERRLALLARASVLQTEGQRFRSSVGHHPRTRLTVVIAVCWPLTLIDENPESRKLPSGRVDTR